MRKPAFRICKIQGTDQLRGNDRSLCFSYIYRTTPFFLNPKLQASSHLLWLYNPVRSDLVGNLEDGFTRDASQIHLVTDEGYVTKVQGRYMV